jgi:hypothetical protein
MDAPTRRRFALATAGLLLAVLSACGSHAKKDAQDDTPIEECTAFVAAYEHCIATLAPANIAQARADQARAGIAGEIAAAQGETAREALRRRCSDNRTNLQATCH